MVALITGGGRGIGQAAALRLAKNGWDVAIAARSANELADTATQAARKMLAIPGDVSKAEDVRTMVERTESELGPIDLLVNNAGVTGPMTPFWETDPKDWWRCQEVNVLSQVLTCHAVVPGMMERKRGWIVNLSSGAGTRPIPNFGAYAVSKCSVLRFSEQLAMELAPHGIRVFPVRPGIVRTRMVESVRKSIPLVQKVVDEGRDHPPEDTADLVEFIASGRADALSGCVLSAGENWDQMVRRAEEIRKQELYTLRVRELEL
jgi:3-oxoacyl-[acyl-carrier protein] reductase